MNPMQIIMSLMQQGQSNPQNFVAGLLSKNPMVASLIQGKNPKDFAFQLMMQRGINPNEFQQMINSTKR